MSESVLQPERDDFVTSKLAEKTPEPAAEQPVGSSPWFWPVAKVALFLGGAYAAILGLLVSFEEQLVFPARKFPNGGMWEGHGLPVEDVYFHSADGTKLHGWYLGHSNPRIAVLYCHGNGGTVAENPALLRWLRNECQASIFIFDYRGYGRSEGSPSETGVLADARAAREWLAVREGIGEEQVVLVGRSLGGAVALDLAAEKGARGLVLESTFTSLPDVAAQHYWWVPVRQLMRSQMNSREKIGRYAGPLLQYHSRADEVVPFSLGEELFTTATTKDKQFFAVDDARHNAPLPQQYELELAKFLKRL
jgi:fermentation-respiration switch protein FrsA (DUF1100 family)